MNHLKTFSLLAGIGLGMVPIAAAHQGQTAKLMASDGQNGDRFGFAIGMDVDTLVVGAPTADRPGTDSGAAYVFVVSGTTWVEQAKLIPSEAFQGDNYGYSVAVSGDVIVIGSPFHADKGADSGTVFIWERNGSVWTESVKILASDGAPGDWLGRSVAVSGSTVIAGAPGGDKFYVINKNGATWSEDAILTGSDTGPGDQFGIVAIDGNTALVGAPFNDGQSPDCGATYVFERSGTVWAEQAKLLPLGGAAGDSFGTSVSISGGQALIGAPLVDNSGLANAGAAYEFLRSGTTWTQVQKYAHLVPGAGDRFGNAVDIAGTKLLAGVRYDDQATNDSGSAFEFYCFPATTPPPVVGCFEILVASDAEAGDQLGMSVAGTSCWYAVGSLDDDSGFEAGAVYTYMLPRHWSFCSAKTNSCGGTPALSHTGQASISSSSGFTIDASGANEGKVGLLLYTDAGRREPAVPFNGGGFLCLNAPIRRSIALSAGGGNPGQCDSSFSIDMNAFAVGSLGGNPNPFLLVPGTVVDCQVWGRDTVQNGIYVTEGFEYTICP